MVGIKPGDLREKVRFCKLERTKEADGFMARTEETYLETFASIKPMRTIQGLEAAKLILMTPYEVIIRARKDKQIEPDMTMWHGEKKYLVREIMDVDMRKSFVKLIAVRE